MDFTTKSYKLGEFTIDCGLINEYDKLELLWPITVDHTYTFGSDTTDHSSSHSRPKMNRIFRTILKIWDWHVDCYYCGKRHTRLGYHDYTYHDP